MLESLANATFRNPIFMLIVFGAIWYMPGEILRRISADKAKKQRDKKQAESIARLYPDENK